MKEITSIIKNNILVERTRNPYAEDECSVVNLEVLTRQLIRWFKYRPITNETEIFDLLIIIFSVRTKKTHFLTVILMKLLNYSVKIS